MHRPTDPTTPPIRARIHERALSRVTKLFNAGLGDIFAELLQNARRGGAGRIDVTVERNELHVRGRQAEDNGAVFLHRGIAARQFHRTFLLAEGIQVTGARLDNGLLHIDLTRPSAPGIVKTVAIESGDGAGRA